MLAPASVQEAIDLTVLAFDLAEKYRSIVVVLADGNIGQMMEPAELPPMSRSGQTCAGLGSARLQKAASGASFPQSISEPEDEEVTNMRLLERWQQIQANEVRYREYYLDDAEIVVVGFGTAGRVAFSAVRAARAEGIRVGLFRPITLSPFPSARLAELSKSARAFLVVEMNTGQMLDDVQRAVARAHPGGILRAAGRRDALPG